MKKRFTQDKPYPGAGGVYTYHNNEDNTYESSNSLPLNWDKFSGKELYSQVISDSFNDSIIRYGMVFQGQSYLKINKLKIGNNGVKHRIKNNRLKAFVTDQDPGDSYSTLKSYVDDDGTPRFYSQSPDDIDEGKSPGTVIDNVVIAQNLYSEQIEYPEKEVPGIADDFDLEASLNPEVFDGFIASDIDGDLTDLFAIDPGYQKLYFIVYMKGDAKKWYGTDKREKRISKYTVDVSEFWNSDGTPIDGVVLDLNNFDKDDYYGGGGSGGAEKAAYKVEEFKVSISLTPGQVNLEGSIPSSLLSQADGVLPSTNFDLDNFDESFLNQGIYRAIKNINNIEHYYSDNSERDRVKEDFFPVPIVNLVEPDGQSDPTMGYSYDFNPDNPLAFASGITSKKYDLQTFQSEQQHRQVVSAPTSIQLRFELKNPPLSDGDILAANTNNSSFHNNDNLQNLTDYAFYVVSWNDIEDEFTSVDDFINDIPENVFDLNGRRREDNLYYFGNRSKPLTHYYSTSGIKNIKAVLFNYCTKTGYNVASKNQIMRWKFVTTRIFLDIPTSKFPDFSQIGGADFTTIPWPHTTGIIGGVSDDSNYKISINNTLSGGKIGSTDLIDETFLVNDLENDELGESLVNFDLEQFRFFNDGTLDMYKLLQIQSYITPSFFPNYSDDDYWTGDETGQTFPMESSVGQIFIDDNIDLFLKENCKIEFNCGNIDDKNINDSSGNSSKGILMGDYKVKKIKKGISMKRDSFLKTPKKSTKNGAI